MLGSLTGFGAWIWFTVWLVQLWRRASSDRDQLVLVLSPLAFVAVVAVLAALVSVAIGPQPCSDSSDFWVP